jgi:hypothetical protein
MTDKPTRDHRQRLEALYREQGEAEPDAGLDWRIRARAHREARSGRLPRPGHWLGGAAVAASLFVVVSVVTHTEPPQGAAPETAPRQSDSAVQDMAPASAARQGVSPGTEVEQTKPAGSERAAPNAFEPAPPPAVLSRAEPARNAERSSSDLIEEERARTLERLAEDRVPLDPELGFPDARVQPDAARAENVQRRLWLIEQYLAVGDLSRAQAELERFRTEYPDASVPERLADALRPGGGESPD